MEDEARSLRLVGDGLRIDRTSALDHVAELEGQHRACLRAGAGMQVAEVETAGGPLVVVVIAGREERDHRVAGALQMPCSLAV